MGMQTQTKTTKESRQANNKQERRTEGQTDIQQQQTAPNSPSGSPAILLSNTKWTSTHLASNRPTNQPAKLRNKSGRVNEPKVVYFHFCRSIIPKPCLRVFKLYSRHITKRIHSVILSLVLFFDNSLHPIRKLLSYRSE